MNRDDYTADTEGDDYNDGDNDTLLEDVLANDNTWTTLVLEVVGLMCDGQHTTLQNYLRDQPDNFKVCMWSTFNIIVILARKSIIDKYYMYIYYIAAVNQYIFRF